MNNFCILIVLSLTFLYLGEATGQQISLHSKIDLSKYDKIEIYTLSIYIESITNLHPDQVKANFTCLYKETGKIQESKGLTTLLNDLKIANKFDSNDLDCRWVFVLSSSLTGQKLEFYMDGGCSKGWFNGYRLEPDPSFASDMKQFLSFLEGKVE